MPVPARRLPSGTIMVADDVQQGQVVVYARVASGDQRGDLDRPSPRATARAAGCALDPSEGEFLGLRRNTGAARFVYNHMLRRVGAVKAQRTAEASYGVAEADLTPWQGWSLPDLRRTWNEVKQWVAPWWTECSKEAFNTGLANLSAALGNWHASRTGARKGRRMGWPRTKKKHGRRAARFTTGAIRVEGGYRHVVLPRLGRIRTHQSTRKLTRRVPAGTPPHPSPSAT